MESAGQKGNFEASLAEAAEGCVENINPASCG